jgi:hypothetical protein
MARISPDEPFHLIHVGKCAGGTVCGELLHAGYAFEHIHVRKPDFEATAKYVVLIRDPASRFASAFHWRQFVLNQPGAVSADRTNLQGLKTRMEHEFLSCFKDANALAELLDPDDPTRGLHGGISLVQLIGHVPLGFSWYLDDLMEAVKPGQIIATIAVESLAEDMQAVFGISVSTHDKMEYPGKAGPLSPSAREGLRRLFSGEYRTLRRLAELLDAGQGHRSPALQSY